MQKLFEHFIKRFPDEIKRKLHSSISSQDDLNPNERLRMGIVEVFKKQLKSKTKTKKIIFELSCLSCYLTQKMKATEEYISLLKRVEHPYIDLFVAYFEEDPSNYKEVRERVEEISQKLLRNKVPME